MTFKSSVEFGYNTELARAVHVRGNSQANLYRPPTPSYNYGPIAIPTNLSIAYRNQLASDYQYDAKSTCSLPPFNADYNDDGLDYSLSGSPYSGYGQEAVGGLSNYSSYGPSRVWVPATPSARSSMNGIYFGSNVAAYGPSQTHFNSSQTYGLRSSVSSELNNFSFSDMTSSLPTSDSSTSHSRILPMPPGPTGRNNSVLAPLHRLANELSYNSNTMNAAGGHPLTAIQSMTAEHSAPLSYLPHQGNADSVDGYNLAGSLSQPQPDLYNTNENWTLAPLTNDPALRSHNSSSDLYYGHCSDAGRKASQSGQSGVNSTLTTSHSSSSDLFSYNSGDHSRRASQSGQSSQSSLNNTQTNCHNSSSDMYYSHCNDTSRKTSHSGQSNANSTLMAGHSYQVPYSHEKPHVSRSSSMASMDIARTASHRPSTGNLHAAL